MADVRLSNCQGLLRRPKPLERGSEIVSRNQTSLLNKAPHIEQLD